MTHALRYCWHPNTACRTLQGAAFILLGSRMLRLNPVGTRMWELFEHGATTSEVARQIAEEFDVSPSTVVADAERFVHDLLARKLLIEAAGDPGSG